MKTQDANTRIALMKIITLISILVPKLNIYWDGQSRFSLSSATPEEDRLDGLNDDHEIEREALILNVIKLVLQFLDRVVYRGAIRIFDLGPAGQAGGNKVTMFVERYGDREL